MRATRKALEALPDHLLADIGVERHMIDAHVEALAGDRSKAVKQRKILPRPLAQWNMSRHAADQMARIDADLLADIGYSKGDVDWVPEVMTARKLADRHSKIAA